jgi:glutaredoxin
VTSLTLYGRPGCHLCEEAERELRRLGIPYATVDVESDDDLLRRYLERIPVGVVDGQEVFELFVDAEALRARLQ